MKFRPISEITIDYIVLISIFKVYLFLMTCFFYYFLSKNGSYNDYIFTVSSDSEHFDII